MNREQFLMLVAYDAYANGLVFDTAARLTDEDFARVVGYQSVHATLVHILAAEALWLARMRGNSMRHQLAVSEFPTLADIRLYYDDLAAALRELIASASEDDLEREQDYVSTSGKQQSARLAQMLMHLFNHSTHHRGELSIMLTQLGQPLPDLDLIYYLRVQSQQ